MASTPATTPPIEPMLAKIADELPAEGAFLYEPKWDGFRALVFRGGDEVYIQSRDAKPLNRYFPELERACIERLPRGCVLDGEIVVVGANGLDFDALQQRLHPAASRVARLSSETPASFVAFDLLAAGGRSTMQLPQAERRVRLERLLGSVQPPIHLTPVTRDRAQAQDWLERFEGAGLDGVIAKPESLTYQPGKRAMLKIKHVRTADCVVVGYRWYRDTDDAVGSLILGLYDDAGELHHVGITSSFTMERRRQLVEELAPLRTGEPPKSPEERSRWSAGKDLTWEPLRPELVCEVKYDHLQGDRFRHATTFVRWRPDKPPQDCRYDQLEVATPFELAGVFSASAPARPADSRPSSGGTRGGSSPRR